MTRHTSPTSLLGWAASRSRSTRPALVDVSAPPARIELSGRVLVNWWAKNVGLLRDELGLGPGGVVLLQLPASWRSVPLALAALSLGATVVEDTADHGPERVDLLITDAPGAPGSPAPATVEAGEVLAVASQPLAMDFGAPLPVGVLDHAAEVRAQPDHLDLSPEETAEAGFGRGLTTGTLEDLEALAAREAQVAEGTVSSIPAERGVLAALAELLATGEAGALLLHAGDELDASTAAQERVTATGGIRLPLA